MLDISWRSVCAVFGIFLFLEGSVFAAAPVAEEKKEEAAASTSDEVQVMPTTVVTATRLPVPTDRAPASVTVITSEEIEQKQYKKVSEALRQVPGLTINQTGTQGQLTTAFIRGLKGDNVQVLIDGIPVNQGFANLYNFADLSTENIDRIEVMRGPQSTLYGPTALAGVIHIFTKRGTTKPTASVSAEWGTYDSFRETLESSGKVGDFDYAFGLTRYDTQNDRPNNEYRYWSANGSAGYKFSDMLEVRGQFQYSSSDSGSPGIRFAPRPKDNLLTEKWLMSPSVVFRPTEWWTHKVIFGYDEERQVSDPNEDGFFGLGPTRSLFQRYQIDYQNDIELASWVTLTSGFYYNRIDAEQERPFTAFPPLELNDRSESRAFFAQFQVEPVDNLIFVLGGRYNHFTDFGEVWTYRLAGSYKIEKTGTTFRSSLATGFSPPSLQDRFFGNNLLLDPIENKGFDVGIEQELWGDRIVVGANYFYNDVSNVIGYDATFAQLLNLGSARTEGVEVFLNVNPIENLTISANYTYTDTKKTSEFDVNAPLGSRLPRVPRNDLFVSASYLWFGKVRTAAEIKHTNAREELSFGAANFDIEDSTVVRLLADWQVNDWLKIYGRIENLFDEEYEEVYGYPNLGQTFWAGFTLTY